MPHTYPLMLNVSNRQIVIIGGGKVAVRKARGLLAAGATKVRVVSLQFHEKMSTEVERIAESYHRKHLHDAKLVFAATDDPAVNDAVVRDAKEIGVLACRADGDDENAGDFTTPAMLRQGPVMVTVSTGGSPALAAKIRDELQKLIDPHWIELAEAMQAIRPHILNCKHIDATRRREIFRSLASEEAIDAVGSGGVNSLLRWIAKQFPELVEKGR